MGSHAVLGLLLALCAPAVRAAQLPEIVGYPADMSDRVRVELLAQRGYFDEALAEIDRLDAEKYAPLRARWLRTDGETRRILRRASPGSEAYLSVSPDSRHLGEALQDWQHYMGISEEEAARSIEEWREDIRDRRRRFEEMRLRYGLPAFTRPEGILIEEHDLDLDGRLEVCVLYQVQPADRITRAEGEAYLRVLRTGANAPLVLGELDLGEALPTRIKELETDKRRLLALESFPDSVGGASFLRVAVLGLDGLRGVSLREGKLRRPLRWERRSAAGSSSDAEFLEGGRGLLLTSQEQSLRDVAQQGIGHLRVDSRREYRWDGRDYELRASTDSVQLTGALLRGMSYAQELPGGGVLSWRPTAQGWELCVSSAAASTPIVADSVGADDLGREKAFSFPGGDGSLRVTGLRLSDSADAGRRGVERMDFVVSLRLIARAPDESVVP